MSWSWAEERLQASRNYWVGTTKPDGAPHAMPVRGIWFDEGVVVSTSPDLRKARNLDRDARAVVHVESGDEVVVREGEAEEIAFDAGMADAYEAKYDYPPSPASPEDLWYRLRPRVVYAWTERDFPKTATRFTFSP